MSPDIWNPLFSNVVKWWGVDHAETQEENIRMGVGQSPEFIKLLLKEAQSQKEIKLVSHKLQQDVVRD